MAAPINYNRKYFEDIFGTKELDAMGNKLPNSLPAILKRITTHMQDKLKANVVGAQIASVDDVINTDVTEGEIVATPAITTSDIWSEPQSLQLLNEVIGNSYDIFAESVDVKTRNNMVRNIGINLFKVRTLGDTQFIPGTEAYNDLPDDTKSAYQAVANIEDIVDRDATKAFKIYRVHEYIEEMNERGLIDNEVFESIKSGGKYGTAQEILDEGASVLQNIFNNETQITNKVLTASDSSNIRTAFASTIKDIDSDNAQETELGQLLGVTKEISSFNAERFNKFKSLKNKSDKLNLMLGTADAGEIDQNLRNTLIEELELIENNLAFGNPNITEEQIQQTLFSHVERLTQPQVIELSEAEGGGVMRTGETRIDILRQREYQKKGADVTYKQAESAVDEYIQRTSGYGYSLSKDQKTAMIENWFGAQLTAYGQGVSPPSNNSIFSQYDNYIQNNVMTDTQRKEQQAKFAQQQATDSEIASSGIDPNRYQFDSAYRQSTDESLDRFESLGYGLTPTNKLAPLPGASYVMRDSQGNPIIDETTGKSKLGYLEGKDILSNLDLFPKTFQDIYKYTREQDPGAMVTGQIYGQVPSLPSYLFDDLGNVDKSTLFSTDEETGERIPLYPNLGQMSEGFAEKMAANPELYKVASSSTVSYGGMPGGAEGLAPNGNAFPTVQNGQTNENITEELDPFDR